MSGPLSKSLILFAIILVSAVSVAGQSGDDAGTIHEAEMVLKDEKVELPREGNEFSLGLWKFRTLWTEGNTIEVQRLDNNELPDSEEIVIYSGIEASGSNVDGNVLIPESGVPMEWLYENNLLAGEYTTYASIYRFQDGEYTRLNSTVSNINNSFYNVEGALRKNTRYTCSPPGTCEIPSPDHGYALSEDSTIFVAGGNPEGLSFRDRLYYENGEGECEEFDPGKKVPEEFERIETPCDIKNGKENVEEILDDFRTQLPSIVDKSYRDQYSEIRRLNEEGKPKLASMKLKLLQEASKAREILFHALQAHNNIKESGKKLNKDYDEELDSFDRKLNKIESLPADRVLKMEKNQGNEVKRYVNLSNEIWDIRRELEDIEEDVEASEEDDFRDKCYDRKVGAREDMAMTEEVMRGKLNFLKINNSSLPDEYLKGYERSSRVQDLMDETENHIDEGHFPDATETVRDIEVELADNDVACKALQARALSRDIEDLRKTEDIEEKHLETLRKAEENLENQKVESAERKVVSIRNQVRRNFIERLVGPIFNSGIFQSLEKIIQGGGSLTTTQEFSSSVETRQK
jgi:hypothetical protein